MYYYQKLHKHAGKSGCNSRKNAPLLMRSDEWQPRM